MSSSPPGWFSAFRDAPGVNTYYGAARTPVTHDGAQVAVWVFGALIAVIIAVLVTGTKGRQRWHFLLRMVFSLSTVVIQLLALTGSEWQTAAVTSHCDYVPAVPSRLSAHIGIRLGLKGVNVTLTGTFNDSERYIHGHVDYNERFSFNKAWEMDHAVSEAHKRGLPWAIVHVLEYFGADGGGLRWCRAFREAGHFTYILLWSSLALWCVSMLLLGFDVSRGAAALAGAGGLMVAAAAVYHGLQPRNPLIIPMVDAYMTLSYGWCFWITLVAGVVTLLSGLVLLLLNRLAPVVVGMVFLHEHQLEELEDSLYEYDQAGGYLQIDTPMRSMRKNHGPYYNNPAFNDTASPGNQQDMMQQSMPLEQPPPYDGCPLAAAERQRRTGVVQGMDKCDQKVVEAQIHVEDESDTSAVRYRSDIPTISNGKLPTIEPHTTNQDVEEGVSPFTSPPRSPKNNEAATTDASSAVYSDSTFDDFEESVLEAVDGVAIQHMAPESQLNHNHLQKTRSVELMYDDTDGVNKAIIEIHGRDGSLETNA